HQLAALDTEVLSHRDDKRVALLCAHHGKADTGVAAGGFDHSLARLELTTALRCFDYAQCQPILDGAQRVERFKLDEKIDAGGRELGNLDDRRAPHGLQDVLEPGHGLPRNYRSQGTLAAEG